MINGYFPTPYPNETVYSILARYFQRLEGFGFNQVMNIIYQSSAVPPDGLPNDIIKFVSNTPLKHSYTPGEIIDGHTLFNLYAVYSGKEMFQELHHSMLSKGKTDKIAFAGLDYDKAKQWNSPRFCLKCAEKDTELYGEPYWHREHQIPGIKVCPHHREITYDVEAAGVVDNSGKRRGFVALDASMLDKKYTIEKFPIASKEFLEKHCRLAINAWSVLNCNDIFELESVKQKYQARLMELGYSWEGARKQIERLRMDFSHNYGEAFLKDIGCTIEEGVQNWLIKTLRGKCFRHPIKQLLVTEFLFGTFEEFQKADLEYKPFGDAPWVCLNPLADHYHKSVIEKCTLKKSNNIRYGVFSCGCGFEYTRHIGTVDKYQYRTILTYGHVFENKVKEISEREHLSEKQVLKKLDISKHLVKNGLPIKTRTYNIDISKKEPYRKTVLFLLEKKPNLTRKQIFDEATKEFQWLRKNDREWFEHFMPEASTKLPSEYRNTNWAELDVAMCGKITSATKNILQQQGKPLRLTKGNLLKIAKAGTIMKYRGGYPKSLELLKSLVESRSEYQIRCVNWAIEELTNKGETVTEDSIRHMTGIRKDDSTEVTQLINTVCVRDKG
ncbi:hypothetical protein SRRS_05250 [Sporomusa rhizae]|uniref:TnsD family Tn7-like transposition protein n=1 Tax=Sporomusa rhizae TaxID=357999 RepID=UPI00352B001C